MVDNMSDDEENANRIAKFKGQWKHWARKVKDTNFEYTCEWNDCCEKFNSLSTFNKHVNDEHKIGFLRSVCQERKITSLEGMNALKKYQFSHF